jgi:cell division protein FtsZ
MLYICANHLQIWEKGGRILSGEISEFSEKENRRRLGLPRILAVGCGYAGNNIVNRLAHLGLEGGKTVAVNDDDRYLALIEADKKILIEKRSSRYSGESGNHEVERSSDESARCILKEELKDMDMVFITADTSGGTGTKVASIVAEISKQKGAIVAVMVTTPINDYKTKTSIAEGELDALRRNADTLIVMDNNRLLQYLPLEKTFSVVEQIIAETIKGITETITLPSLINLDYADVRTIMRTGGASLMFVGEADLSDEPDQIVRIALCNPLLDVDYSRVTDCLLHITGGFDLTLKNAAEIAGALTQKLAPKANVIWEPE